LDLISELGSFGEIIDIGKCGARLGQCFSATLPTMNVNRNEVEVFATTSYQKKKKVSESLLFFIERSSLIIQMINTAFPMDAEEFQYVGYSP